MSRIPDSELEARVSAALHALAASVDDRTAGPGRVPQPADARPLQAADPRFRPWLVPALAAAAVLVLLLGAVGASRVLRSSGRGVPPAGTNSPAGPSVPSRPAPSATSSGRSATTSVARTAPSVPPAPPTATQIADVLRRTVEVGHTSEHFGNPGSPVTISDGSGGFLTALLAARTPSADSGGNLVFFFHNQQFLGWDAAQEADRTLRVFSSQAGVLDVTYQQFGASDPNCCPSLPTVTIHYRWTGHAISPNQPVPAAVYRLNNPYVHPVPVTLQP